MKRHIRLLAKKKVPAFKKACRHTAAKRMAVKEAVRAIVELEPTTETEQRLEALAVRARKAKEASFLDRYRISEAA